MTKVLIGLLVYVLCVCNACTQNINLDIVQCQPAAFSTLFGPKVTEITNLVDTISGASTVFTTITKQQFHRNSYDAKQNCNCMDSVVTTMRSDDNDVIMFYAVKKYLPNKILEDVFACAVKWRTDTEFHIGINPSPITIFSNFGQITRCNLWQIPNSAVTEVAYARGTDVQFADLVFVKGFNFNYKSTSFKSNFNTDTTILGLPGCK